MRALLKQIAPLRSFYHLLLSMRDLARTRPARIAQQCDTLYAGQSDPWTYTAQEQQARYLCALEIIDRTLAGKRGAKILEIGCGEGAFTERLTSRVARLVAVDASPTALARAHARLSAQPNIEFRPFDVLNDRIEETFDLIVIDHVIDMFGRRAIYRQIADRLAPALTADGKVLMGAMRAFDLAENAWWSRLVLRGGVAILDWVGRNTALAPVETVSQSFYTYTLFQKRT